MPTIIRFRRVSHRIARRGAALVMAMVALLVVTLMTAALVQSLVKGQRQSRRYADELQAQWLAEAGVERAFAQLSRDSEYHGETWKTEVNGAAGAVTITVEAATKKVTAEAVYPPEDHRRVLVRREVNAPPLNLEP
jgi:Tfp pilus assembly protein PilX